MSHKDCTVIIVPKSKSEIMQQWLFDHGYQWRNSGANIEDTVHNPVCLWLDLYKAGEIFKTVSGHLEHCLDNNYITQDQVFDFTVPSQRSDETDG